MEELEAAACGQCCPSQVSWPGWPLLLVLQGHTSRSWPISSGGLQCHVSWKPPAGLFSPGSSPTSSQSGRHTGRPTATAHHPPWDGLQTPHQDPGGPPSTSPAFCPPVYPAVLSPRPVHFWWPGHHPLSSRIPTPPPEAWVSPEPEFLPRLWQGQPLLGGQSHGGHGLPGQIGGLPPWPPGSAH